MNDATELVEKYKDQVIGKRRVGKGEFPLNLTQNHTSYDTSNRSIPIVNLKSGHTIKKLTTHL